MPIYEYRCKTCNSVAEFLVNIGEDVTISCPNCGSLEMEKVMSAVSFMSHAPEIISGKTCCGLEERCESPPCSTEGSCRKDEF